MPAVPRITYRRNAPAGSVTMRRATLLPLNQRVQLDDLFRERLGAADVVLRRVVGNRCAIQLARLVDNSYVVHTARWSVVRVAWVWSSRFQPYPAMSLRSAYREVNRIFLHYERGLAALAMPPQPRPAPQPPQPPRLRCTACGTDIVEPATQCASCIDAGRAANGEL